MTRTVIVLNHFAQPLTAPGGTRHVELFSRLQHWDARVIAANRNLIDGTRVVADGILETVKVTAHSGNGPARVLKANSNDFAPTSSRRELLLDVDAVLRIGGVS